MINRLLSPLLACALLLTVWATAPVAEADETVPFVPAPVVYTPTTKTTFNNPDGTPEEQFALLDEITKSIKAAPKGSIIRIAVYSFSYGPMASALIKAKRRGVQVKLLIDSHATTDEIKKLRRALGTSRKKTSYVQTCTYGCMSSKPSFMHAKIYLFSTAGKAKRVTMIASANPAWAGAREAWNNMYTMVGDTAMYTAHLNYFKDMLADKTNTRYYRTTTSGRYKAYFYPRAGKTPTSDPMYNVLRQVKCTGAAPGYGNADGRTVVRIAAYRWTLLRKSLADQLALLKGAGCDVEVIYSADTVDPAVAAALVRSGTPVFDGRLDRSGDGQLGSGDLYIHSKYLLINGAYGASTKTKVVYTGSSNFSQNSLRESNDTQLRIQLDPVYDQFLANFDFIKNGYTTPVTPVAVALAKRSPDSAERTADARTGDDYRIESNDE